MEKELHIFGSFKIYQPKKGYRFSMEPFILSRAFINIKKVFVDFGSGSGIIAIIIAKNNPNSLIFAVEKNKQMIDLINKNAEINKLTNIITISDIKNIKENSVDIFISNPPYFKKTSYRVSSKFYEEKFEENEAFLNDLIKNAKRVLKNKGTLRISHHPTRFMEVAEYLNKHNFGIKKITPVYGTKNKKASFLIIDSTLTGKNHIEFEPPILLNREKDWSTI